MLTRGEDSGSGAVTFNKVMQDITRRKEQEDQLHRSVEEKSLLVREIHHRVKNNLQMLVSLLSLQASYTRDPHILSAFEETEARVRAMAHVHEQLYTSDDLSTVEVGSYLAALARELVSIHAGASSGIELETDVRPMTLHIEKAIPVGLIANELLLNSLKHGLPSGSGQLKLTFRSLPRDNGVPRAELCVEDSGPGFPPEFDFTQGSSMGYQLINLLVRQLRARLEVRPGPGASITVGFPVPDKAR